MTRLLFVASLLVLGTACFQSKAQLTLTAQGSGHWEQTVLVEPVTSSMLALRAKDDPAFKETLSPAKIDQEKLAAEGLTGVAAEMTDGDRWKMHAAADFARPESLSWLLTRNDADADPIDLREVGPNEYVLTLALDSDDEKKEDDGPGPMDKMPEKKKQKLLGELFLEIGKLELVQAIDVPGEILEVTPASGQISGHTATWTLGAKDVMGGIGEALEAPAEPPPPRNHFTVRFRTEAPLPPEALSG